MQELRTIRWGACTAACIEAVSVAVTVAENLTRVQCPMPPPQLYSGLRWFEHERQAIDAVPAVHAGGGGYEGKQHECWSKGKADKDKLNHYVLRSGTPSHVPQVVWPRSHSHMPVWPGIGVRLYWPEHIPTS